MANKSVDPDREKLLAFLISRRLAAERTTGSSVLDDPKIGPTWDARVRAEYESLSNDQLRERIAALLQKDEEARLTRERNEEEGLPFNRPEANADLTFWGKMARWSLEEAVAPSLGKDPSLVSYFDVEGGGERMLTGAMHRSPFRREFLRRRALAVRANQAHEIGDPVNPGEFLSWAVRVYSSIPAPLLETVQAMGKKVADIETLTSRLAELERSQSALGPWPWGIHETALLKELAAAATRFWVNYDAGDVTTAPRNDDVVEWLRARNVSKNIAEAIATILRADGIATGPRSIR